MRIVEFRDLIFNFFFNYGKSISVSLLVLFVGIFTLKKASNLLSIICRRSNFGTNVLGLFNYVIKFLIYYLIVFFILDQFGINAWNIIAPLGASVVALSVIFKEGISNFLSGIFIFVNQTFKPGDYVELSSVKGTVVQIRYFYTTIYTDDAKSAIVPNAKIISEVLFRKSNCDILPINLTVRVINRNSETIDNTQIQNLIKIIETSLLLHFKNIMDSPRPSFTVLENKYEISVLFWSAGNDIENSILALSSAINNKIENFDVDLSFSRNFKPTHL